eukprot:TRINITY_DN3052_c0_g1_i7.p3 TRINITY_DN3052_c0_g1~~TRINITY_DN3052_c0_g1_i7.p3  ORF type:complete len:111 (-),score=4.38 TRINITY_DN3052_c0_g1_i7:507-839(-)
MYIKTVNVVVVNYGFYENQKYQQQNLKKKDRNWKREGKGRNNKKKEGQETDSGFFFRWVTFYIASWQYFSFVQFPFIYQKYIYTYKYKNNQYNIYSRLSLIRNPRAKKPF